MGLVSDDEPKKLKVDTLKIDKENLQQQRQSKKKGKTKNVIKKVKDKLNKQNNVLEEAKQKNHVSSTSLSFKPDSIQQQTNSNVITFTDDNIIGGGKKSKDIEDVMHSNIPILSISNDTTTQSYSNNVNDNSNPQRLQSNISLLSELLHAQECTNDHCTTIIYCRTLKPVLTHISACFNIEGKFVF